MYNKGWQEEMNKMVQRTIKNWWSTGNRKCAAGISGSIHLGYGVEEDKKAKKSKKTTL